MRSGSARQVGLEELCVCVYDGVVLTWIWGLDQPGWFGGALCLVCMTGLYLHGYEVWISKGQLRGAVCVYDWVILTWIWGLDQPGWFGGALCVYDWVALTWIWGLDQPGWFGGALCLCVWLGCTYIDMRSGSARLVWRSSVSVGMTGLYLYRYKVWISYAGLKELCV